MRNRPAETGGVAGALGLLIGYFAGIDDVAVIVALGVVIGFLPAAITWLVEMSRRGRGEAGQADITLILLVVITLGVLLLLFGVRFD